MFRKDKMAIKTVNILFNEQTLKEIDGFAKKEALSRSDVLRIGARKYIRAHKDWRVLQQKGEQEARRLGLKSEEDIIKKLRK